MKWFMCLNGHSANHQDMSKVAVLSALKNTTLEPYLVYDGVRDAYTEWMISKGVKVFYRTLTYIDEMRKCTREQRGIGAGAYLRTEIPLIAKDLGLPDKYVLYTDCDVMFIRNPSESVHPEYFSCGPESDQQEKNHCNTGVMYMNLHSLYYTYDNFRGHVLEYLGKRAGYDQTAYNTFYEGLWDRLPVEMNWKPYWGINDDAKIIHWHGPKPCHISTMKSILTPEDYGVLNSLWKRDKAAYDHYLQIWDSFATSL